MKTTYQKILVLLTIFISSYGFTSALGVDHFSVTFSPDKVKVGESVDLEITAVDKNNNIVNDYNGIILIFSETDQEVELPSSLEDNTYTFSSSDQGSRKFENGVKFKESGIQDIHIYDLDDSSIFGVSEIRVEEDKDNISEKIDINIISPTDGLTIGEKNIIISGNTKKNHNVEIVLNGKDKINTTSNDQGIYEKEIEGLKDGENSIVTNVLNADGKIVGSSNKVNIKIDLNKLNLKNIKITPEKVNTESEFEIEVLSNPGLKNVNVIINESIISLQEESEGVYKAKSISNKDAGIYKVDVILKDELGHELKKLGVSSFEVKKVKLESAKPKKEVVIKTINTEVKEENNNNVKGLKLIELKSKSVLTWNKTKGALSYNIYKKDSKGDFQLFENTKIEKIEIAISGDNIKYDYFAVKAVFEDKEGEIYEGDLSEATKVQTGPELLILLIMSLFIGGLIVISSKKRV